MDEREYIRAIIILCFAGILGLIGLAIAIYGFIKYS